MKSINSLGFIEVYGFVAGIEAADAMLKSAQVRLLYQHEVTPGLISLVIEGDLAACRAAVNAGVAAASRIGLVVSSNVMGRPAGDTVLMALNLLPSTPVSDGSTSQAPPVESQSRPIQNNKASSEVIEETTSLPEPVMETITTEPVVEEKHDKITEQKDQSDDLLAQIMTFIDAALRGRSWVEITRRFPELPVSVRSQLDGLVKDGKLIKVGARYRKPLDRE